MADKDPYIYRIKQITKVIDGDTIDADIDLGFDISLTKRIRLAGVDTPESRTADANEKKYGLEAKEWLKHKVENALYVDILYTIKYKIDKLKLFRLSQSKLQLFLDQVLLQKQWHKQDYNLYSYF